MSRLDCSSLSSVYLIYFLVLPLWRTNVYIIFTNCL